MLFITIYWFSFINIDVTLKLVNTLTAHTTSPALRPSVTDAKAEAKNIMLHAFRKFGQAEFLSYYLAPAANFKVRHPRCVL